MALLTGKVAIITGSGNGIGREHALYMAKLGAKIVVNDLGGTRDGTGASTRAADAVVEEIKKLGGEAVASYDSVSTLEGATSMVWAAMNKFGRLDILVNNAGILRDRTLINMSEAEFDTVISVHLKGSFLCTQAAARAMKLQNQGGRIVNTTSVSGLLGNFGQGNYSSAKGGIYSLTRTASMEFQKFNVNVNAVAPVAKTRMTEDLAVMKSIDAVEMGPQHIAPVVAFLSSDLAKDINGRIFGVHGTKVFEYKMEQTEGVTKSGGAMWTPEELKERFSEITKS
jgi:NAD(P)-dependent dehydrogenase (short-subunit alcohol dehydrogenase family)